MLKGWAKSFYSLTYTPVSCQNLISPFQLLSVADSGRGQGLAYDVISRSVELAKCLGYKMCKAEATGDFSRKAFLKAGFHVTAECKYSDWKFDNKKVFSGITDHQGIAFVVKIL